MQRQAGPHAHSVSLSPDNKFLIVADLGLDQILVYRFDGKNGRLTPNNPAFTKVDAGSGRDTSRLVRTEKAWVLNEMTATITTLKVDKATGSFTPIQTTSTLPSQFSGAKSAAEIAVHPNGRFLYTSNRGHDTIAIFDIDPGAGLIRSGRWVSTRGRTPSNLLVCCESGFEQPGCLPARPRDRQPEPSGRRRRNSRSGFRGVRRSELAITGSAYFL